MSQSGKVTDAGGGGGADTFDTDSGTAVEVAGVINILGSGGTDTAGAGNTVTINSVGSTIDTDSGSAVPSAGVINILGTAPLTTSGAGNTVTLADDGTFATTFLTDSGSAIPSSNAIAMSGGTGLNTTGAGAVVTTNLDSPVIVENGGSERTSALAFSVICGGTTATDPHQSVVSVGTANQRLTSNGAGALPTFQDATSLDDLEFAASDGSAFPSSDIINITGGNGIGTAGAGNTVDISLNSPVLVTTGGTGRNSALAFGVVCGGTTSTTAQQSIASVGTAAQVLTSNGAGSLPTFQAAAAGGGGVWQFVSTAVASASATIEFNNLTAASYKIVILDLLPATDNTDLMVRVSDDNGSTFAVIDYQYVFCNQETGSFFGVANNSGTSITVNTLGIGTGAGEFGLSGEMNFWDIATTGQPAFCTWQFGFLNLNGGNLVRASGTGCSADDGNAGSTQDIDALQFLMSTGNISTGTFHLYSLVTS